jgi:hypothetical protein
MSKEIDSSTFEATTPPSSASPVINTLQGTLYTQCNALESDASPKQAYTIDEVAQILGIARRTAFKYASEVLEVWFWLSEAEFRKVGIYTEFALTELKNRKSFARLDDYRQAVHDANVDRIQQTLQQPTEPAAKTSTLARFVEPDASPFSGLSISTKATDKREVLQAELVETEAEVDADFEAFMSLSTELVTQDEAADEADELEFKLLRKRNAAKWLKRKAILEADKQQILQGDIRPKQPGNSPAAVS